MKIGLISLGCPKNLVDGEVMLGLAQQAGHELTPHAADADVIVVNTCAFIDRAKQESIDAILEMAELKKASPSRRLVVTGCLAERYRDELREQIPEIDALLGTGEVPEIVGALSGERTPPGAWRLSRWCSIGRVRRERPSAAWRAHRAADLYLRCRYAPHPCDAAALRLRENRRGLRLQVRLLHHPEAPRDSIEAVPRPPSSPRPVSSPRLACVSSSSSARTRPSTASTAASAARSPACCAS